MGDLRAVRRRSTRRLRELELPDPFTTTALAQHLSAQRGRPLHLQAAARLDDVCGLWIALEDVDYVFYDASAQGLHREHIVAHELAHVMWSHGSSGVLAPELIAALLPDFAPSSVRAMFSRTSYSSTEEQEAEVLASLVLQQAEAIAQSESPEPSHSSTDGPAAFLAAAMGQRARRGQ